MDKSMRRQSSVFLFVLRVSLLFIAVFFAVAGISSCDVFSVAEEETFVGRDSTAPDSSLIRVAYAGRTLETRGGVYQLEVDRDAPGFATETVGVELHHLKDGADCAYGWTFTSPDIRINNISSNGFSISCAEMSRPGSYTINAKSEVSDALDKVLIVNCRSALSEIAASYVMEESFVNHDLSYDSGMLQGVVTRFTRSITLVAGAEYRFSVYDPSGKTTEIGEVSVTRSGEVVSVREYYDNTFRLLCKVADGGESEIEVSVLASSASLKFKVLLSDNSETTVSPVSEKTERENCISLVRNENGEDKSYTYKVETVSSVAGRVLEFSIDMETWTREAEEAAAESPYFKPEKNDPGAVHWLCNSTEYRTFEGKTLFKVDFDGQSGTFSITPRANTVYTHSKSLQEKNLHCYIYVKYAEDDPTVYRQKWRIMIGGCLETLELVTGDPSSGSETLVERDIAVREDSETGWIFRARYVPSTTERQDTLWYLSSSKDPVRYRCGESYFDAPAPLSSVPADKNRQKVLNFLQEASVPFTALSAYVSDYGDPFVAYKYFYDSAEEGYSDLWTTYNSLALDVVLVALNVDERKYCTVGIKDTGDKLITVKSLNGNAKALVYNEFTGYDDGDVQQYPNTVVSGFEGERTFYMDLRETLRLCLQSSFKITSFDVWGDSRAREIFPSVASDLEETGLFATIRLQTLYTMLDTASESSREEARRLCLEREGVILYAKINNKYVVKLRIVVHEDGSNG